MIVVDNVSLIKTNLRTSRRGEVASPVGVRRPNPYENLHTFLLMLVDSDYLRKGGTHKNCAS